MILGILGKGGSGKTTTATLLTQTLNARGSRVLAIDADHNMDLAYNLGFTEPFPYFGSSLGALTKHIGLQEGAPYRSAFNNAPHADHFSMQPDAYTSEYSQKLNSGVRLMVAGPHTDSILYDESCSHVLTTPLKVYLPFLKLDANEYAIVDEKAGLDGVGTGVTTGFTAALVVAEPKPHSIKVAKQIAELLKFYETPYAFVLTKVLGDADRELGRAAFGDQLIATIDFAADVPSTDEGLVAAVCGFGKRVSLAGDTRLARSRAKIERNSSYQTSH